MNRPALRALATLGMALTLMACAPRLEGFLTAQVVEPSPLAAPTALNGAALHCPKPTEHLDLALWTVAQRFGGHDYSCQNAYVGLIHMPNPGAAYSDQPQRASGGFDVLADLVRGAKSEVLFSTMEWDSGKLNPGSTLAESVVDLYGQVRANPAAYPDGLSVKIALGNYPSLGDLSWGNQLWNVIDDLVQARLPAFSDPALGWNVVVGNYASNSPYSHVKHLVIDGRDLVVAGFNYGSVHLPRDHPSGRGEGLRDFALHLRGPVAQDGVNVFDDLWGRSRAVTCPAGVKADEVKQRCREVAVRGDHPARAHQVVPAGTARAYSLYRRDNFLMADEALTALLRASQQSVELMQVNFSMKFRCEAAILRPSACPYSQAMPWMTALMDAIEGGVRVRALLDDRGLGGLENRVGLSVFQRELGRRGLADRFEARWFPSGLHAKTMLIDGKMLVVGSQNLHYSSWTDLGLNEYNLATSDVGAAQDYGRVFESFWPLGKVVDLGRPSGQPVPARPDSP